VEVASTTAVHPGRARGRAVVLRAAAGVGTGAILVLAFLRLVDVRAVLARLEHLSAGFAALCGAAFLGAYFVRAMRWRCLLKPDDVSVWRAAAIYQVATFLNWLLPIRGGELAKSLLLRRSNGIPVSRSLATVSMDKAMDLVPAIALVAVLPFAGLHLSSALVGLLLSALGVVGVAAAVLALAAWRPDRAAAVLTRLLTAVLPARARRRVKPMIMLFLDTLVALVRQPRVLLVALSLTVVAVGLDALFCLLAFRAVGIAVSLPVVVYGYTLFNLAFILPTPPGQVGSNEVIGLLIFSGVFGVDRSGVGAMFLFSHPWTAALMTLSGLLCLSAMGLSLRSTLRLAQQGRPDGGAL
jgi:uncharacterized protein (TIRG00374 family)